MKNAHLRMGSLQFTKTLRDTTIDITLRMDRMIAEHDADNRSARCHLLSVIGNDQEVAAIAAAIADEARFYASGPDVNRLMITLGKEAEVFRSSISIPGRRRPLRHLVAISEELSKTRAGGNPSARRTILCDDDRAFQLYRISGRFGLPVLPEWSEWLRGDAGARERDRSAERNRLQPGGGQGDEGTIPGLDGSRAEAR